MPLNKLDNFIKNTEGRILYVSPSDLDSTDSISNQGNSLAQPFKTLQRALLESARFSYRVGDSNDEVEKTTILLMPGAHTIDNRPGYTVYNDSGTAKAKSPSGLVSNALDTLSLTLESSFDLTQEDNILYKFNSINGGVVIPRGTSVVGLDLRKTKLRPLYVPNPTDPDVDSSAIFRITGACYFWQFSVFDGNENGLVYTDPIDFSDNNKSTPTFSHNKLTVFEYADGVNEVGGYGLTDLDMYYAKLSNAYNVASEREIDVSDKYPSNPEGFNKQRPEWEIVGAFAPDPLSLYSIESGSGGVVSSLVTVVTNVDHNLTEGTPIKISDVFPLDYNISTKVQSVLGSKTFTYLLLDFAPTLIAQGNVANAKVTIETDTVSGASPYIFNCSMRSVYGMNGMKADGSQADGFKSMVVAQFTGVSLQKDDRAFVKYNKSNRDYSDKINISKVSGEALSIQSSSLGTVYHLSEDAIYRQGWETSHIKITNDAILQIVSVFAIGCNKHFDISSGGDASITNSNSNFGQISLAADGFKKKAFEKDNKAFITNVMVPRDIENTTEEIIDWMRLDISKTLTVAATNRLYLYGFTDEDNVPPVITQGYRVGAQVLDKLYVNLENVGYGINESNILMSDGVTSSVKEYPVTTGPVNDIFTIGSNSLATGEKVIILSDDGDLPENIELNVIYYVIDNGDNNTIKLAASASDAVSGTPIQVYLGTNLKILSRVSDKIAGDVGHPVQWDPTNNQWYINTNAGSDIYSTFSALGTGVLGDITDASYLLRISDSRSLDEKLYKLRVVIPNQLGNAKNPENGYIIQESSSTGARNNDDFTLPSTRDLTVNDYDYDRNPSYISTCSIISNTVTVITELPHKLNAGDAVNILNVTDDVVNTGIATFNRGYNGTFDVSSIVDDMTFKYTTTATPGGFTNNTTNRTIDLPRIQRNNLQDNLYVYRNEIISEYIDGIQDGVYHLYALSADNRVPTEFTEYKYGQNITDLYPQLDRDNLDSDPASAESFAQRSPLGKVVTNDLKKSVTKKTVDKTLVTLGLGHSISAVSDGGSSATLTFDREHGFAGVVTYSTLSGGTGYSNGTYYNIKLYNEIGLSSWNGATANIGITGNAVTSATIHAFGSGYSDGDELFFDNTRFGGSPGAKISVATAGISSELGNVVQFTGSGTTANNGYYRITSIPSKTQIAIAKTAGDPVPTMQQYAVVTAPSVEVNTNSYTSATGIQEFTCLTPHGLVAGNKFTVLDSSNNKLGSFTVSSKTSKTVFTSLTNRSLSATWILRHGLDSTSGVSDASTENIGARGLPLFDNEILTADVFLTATNPGQIRVSSPFAGTSDIAARFPYGSYIQIDSEIMRIASNTLGGAGNDEITVIRGALATKQVSHSSGSLIRKIKPIPVEFRRPSIIRASGHTFEYLGYGPGNYSTALPQVQTKTLTETEDYLAQAQEKSGGMVVYTGMNSKGDFYIGNRKTSSATGEETTFDTPVPTITGEDPSRLSVVFDEVTVKERIVVEGGDSNTVLSQFDGPVTFNKDIKCNDVIDSRKKIKANHIEAGTLKVTGISTFADDVNFLENSGSTSAYWDQSTTTLVFKDDVEASFGDTKDFQIYHDHTNQKNVIKNIAGSILPIEFAAQEVHIQGVNQSAFSAKFNVTAGQVLYYNAVPRFETVSGGVKVTGELLVTDDVTAYYSSDKRLKDNITPIEDPLAKVISISGNTFNWNEASKWEGKADTGVVAQEVEALGLPGLTDVREDGTYAVRYEKLVPVLIEAIKELSAKVDNLEQKLSDK